MLNRACIISTFLVICFSCKKAYHYPEDPKKTCRDPETRLQGRWYLYDYTFKGNSIYNSLNKVAHDICNLDNVVLHYEAKSHDNYDQGVEQIEPYSPLTFSFHNANATFRKYVSDDSTFAYWFITPYSFSSSAGANWNITKLFGTDFNLVLATDSGEYKIYFKRK